MGRIDDALRRAAAVAAEDGAPVPRPEGPAGVPDDIEALAREAFPIEIDEHRRGLRQVSPVQAPPPGSTEAPAGNATLSPAAEPPRSRGEARVPSIMAPTTPAVSFDRVDARLAGKIVVDADISPASREQYRRLAATLHHAQASHGLKVVMVTSALMSEGKTLTASNLALTLSESYKKSVLLIDGDLRRPAIHTLFRLDASPGLSEGLTSSDDQPLSVRQVSPRLGVLTAGSPSSDPIAGLTSKRMHRVIEEARDAFDWVIVDTPPVALLPDTNLLAAMADGALLVVRAGSTPWDLAQRAVQAIGRDRVLGVVLNRSTAPSQDSSYGYYEYYSGQHPSKGPDTP